MRSRDRMKHRNSKIETLVFLPESSDDESCQPCCKQAEDDTDNNPDKDISEIVFAYKDTAYAYHGCPEEYPGCIATVFHTFVIAESYECGYGETERIGCMRREETETSAWIFKKPYPVLEHEVIAAWPDPADSIFYEVAELIAHPESEGC